MISAAPSIDRTAEVGLRIRRMRQVKGLSQGELAAQAGISAGLMSHIEQGRSVCPQDALNRAARALGCGPAFLTGISTRTPPTRPWLRAYADAPQKELDRQLGEATNVIDVVDALRLRRVPVNLPVFDGDLADAQAIEDFALHVRAIADVEDLAVIGHMTRTAERLGCIVLPMKGELGRHMGMSTRFGEVPVISVSRPSEVPEWHVPGDRQRLTVAHELGHLTLHASVAMPNSPEAAREVERQAFRFGAAFLAPAEAMYEELEELGGRVTLKTLAEIKSRWGVAIKMLIGRFRDMGVIGEDQARSLYKQISARGWNKGEPVHVGNEDAIWLGEALVEWAGGRDLDAAVEMAGHTTQLDSESFKRWLDWSPTKPAHDLGARVISFPSRRR